MPKKNKNKYVVPEVVEDTGESSNGRTADFESVNCSSNLCSSTKTKKPEKMLIVSMVAFCLLCLLLGAIVQSISAKFPKPEHWIVTIESDGRNRAYQMYDVRFDDGQRKVIQLDYSPELRNGEKWQLDVIPVGSSENTYSYRYKVVGAAKIKEADGWIYGSYGSYGACRADTWCSTQETVEVTNNEGNNEGSR